MPARTTIEILHASISAWIEHAEAALQQAAHEPREAVAFSQRFEDARAALPRSHCPFCGDQMIDTAPLQVFGDELQARQQYFFRMSASRCTASDAAPIAPTRRVNPPGAGRLGVRRCSAPSSRQIFSVYCRT